MTRKEFILGDGRTLAWRETGSGPPLVMLHGWSISGLAFAEIAARLSPRFRVLLPDLPGHGGSSPCTGPGLEPFAADLESWLVGVAPQRACLAGWSLGGMVALEMARRARARLTGLVLISTTPRFTSTKDWPHGLPAGQVKALKRNLARRFEATLADFFKLTFAGEVIPLARLREIRHMAVYPESLPDPQVAAALLDVLTVQDQRDVLGGVTLPVAVIQGEEDRVTPVGAAEFLAGQLPDSRFTRLPNVGHAPFWSRPEEVALLIEEASAWFR